VIVPTLAQAYQEMAHDSDVDSDWEIVNGIPCSHHPIPWPWATQARVTVAVPSTAALSAAVEWLESRSTMWTVATRADHTRAPVFRDLNPWQELPAHVLSDPEGLDKAPTVPGLTIDLARDPEEFLAIWGRELAPMLTPRHLTSPAYRHVIGRIDGQAVACARIRRTAQTAYLSAVTVRPQYRGRGIGTAVSAAASRLATELANVVWLHATAEAAPLYRRLGYRHVDDHVLLTSTTGF